MPSVDMVPPASFDGAKKQLSLFSPRYLLLVMFVVKLRTARLFRKLSVGGVCFHYLLYCLCCTLLFVCFSVCPGG